MTERILGEVTGEGFTSVIKQNSDRSISFIADADINADGANGQNGLKVAYTNKDNGSELLANGGMKIVDGVVVPKNDWAKDIVIMEPNGKTIRVFDHGMIASKTAYHFPGYRLDDPNAYVDSEEIPSITVPPLIITKTPVGDIILGAKCFVRNAKTGQCAWGIVNDVGPRNKNGEISIAMARAIGVNPSPKTGGVDTKSIEYHIYPSTHFHWRGKSIPLQRSNGTYAIEFRT